jgi:RND family efflux transporter MFP subunit
MLRGTRIALAFALLASLACGRSDSQPVVSPDSGPAADLQPVAVETAVVRRGTVLPKLSAPGSIVARRSSEIGAEVTGRIERIFVDVGDHVQAGDPLFEIDRSSYEASVRGAEAALELARAERRQLHSDLERARGLRQKEALSQQDLEQVETRLAVARARERQAEASLVIARESLVKTRVVAPYDGSVAQRLVDEGTTARTMPQTIVLQLHETGKLEAWTGLPEAVHARVHVGDRALVTVEGLADPIETQVFSVADTIDPATRTFLVRMQIANPDHRIKAGAFGRVEIFPGARSEGLLIPREAVRSQAGRTSVLAVRDDRAVEVSVQLGIVSENAVEVLGGLDAGEVVVVGEAAHELAPGTPVTPRSREVDSRT